MTEETEYQKLKRSIDEWRNASISSMPSITRILDAAERELARMPQPVTRFILCWLEPREKAPVMRSSTPYETREKAERARIDVMQWITNEPKIVEVTLDYTPDRS